MGGEVAIEITEGGMASMVCRQLARCPKSRADVTGSIPLELLEDMNFDTSWAH